MTNVHATSSTHALQRHTRVGPTESAPTIALYTLYDTQQKRLSLVISKLVLLCYCANSLTEFRWQIWPFEYWDASYAYKQQETLKGGLWTSLVV